MNDNVTCCNCGFVGAVELGREDCPRCGVTGVLAWNDPAHPETPNVLAMLTARSESLS